MPIKPLVVHEEEVSPERWSDPVRGEVGFRTLFGDGTTESDSLTVGVCELHPGEWLGHHRHEPAEVYYVLRGHGAVVLGDREHPVDAGSAVFIPGNLEHGIRNTRDELLRFVYAFAVGSLSDIEYRF